MQGIPAQARHTHRPWPSPRHPLVPEHPQTAGMRQLLQTCRLRCHMMGIRYRLVCNLPVESAFGEQIGQAEGLELQHEVKLSEGRRCLVYLVQKEVGGTI